MPVQGKHSVGIYLTNKWVNTQSRRSLHQTLLCLFTLGTWIPFTFLSLFCSHSLPPEERLLMTEVKETYKSQKPNKTQNSQEVSEIYKIHKALPQGYISHNNYKGEATFWRSQLLENCVEREREFSWTAHPCWWAYHAVASLQWCPILWVIPTSISNFLTMVLQESPVNSLVP